MILTASQDSPLTLFGTGGDTFIPLSLLDQILSADFFQKRPNFFGGENWNQSGYFDTLPSEFLVLIFFLKVVVTDTIPHDVQKLQCHKIKTLDILITG